MAADGRMRGRLAAFEPRPTVGAEDVPSGIDPRADMDGMTSSLAQLAEHVGG